MKAMTSVTKECVNEYIRIIHSVTKFSPDYLMDGHDSHIVPISLIENRDLTEHRAKALRNSKENYAENKKRIDKNRRSHVFRVDDLVRVDNGNKLNRNKLDPIRVGPFRVLRRVSESMLRKKEEGS